MAGEDTQSDRKPIDRLTLIVLISIAVAILWLANLLIGWYAFNDFSEAGPFGDQFGAVNSLFSGLAFGGVIYAIALQRYEISITLSEISRSKDLIERQIKALADQNSASQKRDFEQTFFNMLMFFSTITNEIDIRGTGDQKGSIISKGKDSFVSFLNNLHREIQVNQKTKESPGIHVQNLGPRLSEYDCDVIDYSYEQIYQRHASDLGHYFRLLYNIVSFIDRSEGIDKVFYARILRAQLSDAECGLLLYNSLSKYGREKLKPLVEQYSMLKNIQPQYVFSPENIRAFDPGAFGEKPTYIDRNEFF